MPRLALVAAPLCLLAGIGCEPPAPRTPPGPSGVAPAPYDPDALRRLPEGHARGALIYVPVYSSLFHPAGRSDINLSATLSIHNVSLDATIEVSAVSYFGTSGNPLREFAPEPLALKPMQTRQFVIARNDVSGGTGANFLVKWAGPATASPPVVEAVMLSTSGQQGISMVTRGTEIEQLDPAAAR